MVPSLSIVLAFLALFSTFAIALPPSTLEEGGNVVIEGFGQRHRTGSHAVAVLFPAVNHEARARYMGNVPESLKVRSIHLARSLKRTALLTMLRVHIPLASDPKCNA